MREEEGHAQEAPLSSSPVTAPTIGGSLTSSMVAVASCASFPNDDEDISNRMAEVIQRFARCHVLSSSPSSDQCRRASYANKEKLQSIRHPSLLLHNEDGSEVTRRVSSITMADFEESSGSHHFVNFGMKSNTVVCQNSAVGSRNTSSASSCHMSSLSEMSSNYGDFRFDPDSKHAYTEPMNDSPLQVPTRAGSMSTISSHSYSTLTTHSTISRGIAHLPTTAEEEDNGSAGSEGNNGNGDERKKKNSKNPVRHSGSWDGFDAMPSRRF
ncbi:MAG: hypothetical protein SGARI_004138, partial [Bacillariaceae sp.]